MCDNTPVSRLLRDDVLRRDAHAKVRAAYGMSCSHVNKSTSEYISSIQAFRRSWYEKMSSVLFSHDEDVTPLLRVLCAAGGKCTADNRPSYQFGKRLDLVSNKYCRTHDAADGEKKRCVSREETCDWIIFAMSPALDQCIKHIERGLSTGAYYQGCCRSCGETWPGDYPAEYITHCGSTNTCVEDTRTAARAELESMRELYKIAVDQMEDFRVIVENVSQDALSEMMFPTAPPQHWMRTRSVLERPTGKEDRRGCNYREGCDIPYVAIELRESAFKMLRPYQREAVASVLNNGRVQSGTVVIPCGGGKTAVMAGIIASVRRSSMIVCSSADSAEYVRHDIVRKWTHCDPDRILVFHGRRRPPKRFLNNYTDGMIIITTYHIMSSVLAETDGIEDGVSRMWRTFIKNYNFAVVCLDEMHNLFTDRRQEFLMEMRCCQRDFEDPTRAAFVGLTATPERNDGRHESEAFKQVFGNDALGSQRIYCSIDMLRKKKYIATVKTIMYNLPPDSSLAMIPDKMNEVTRMCLESNRLNLIALLLSRILKNAKSRVIVYFPRLAPLRFFVKTMRSESTSTFFKSRGVKPPNVFMVDGSITDVARQRAYASFCETTKDETKETGAILVMSQVGSEAINLPPTTHYICVCIDQAVSPVQMIGRVQRATSTKHKAVFMCIGASSAEVHRFETKLSLYALSSGYNFKRTDVTQQRIGDVGREVQVFSYLRTGDEQTSRRTPPPEVMDRSPKKRHLKRRQSSSSSSEPRLLKRSLKRRD